jgi:hypothetical protein
VKRRRVHVSRTDRTVLQLEVSEEIADAVAALTARDRADLAEGLEDAISFVIGLTELRRLVAERERQAA